jgi:Ca-activated chloride channel family protein
VFGRYRGAGGGERSLTVTGRRGGREERFTTAARFDGEPAGLGYLQQLWAARKAGALSREIRLHGPNPEIVDELKRLALRYGILTEYTSYLVQEPSLAIRPVPLMAPAPRDQAGADAVMRSEAARKMAGSANLQAVVVTGAATGRAAPAAAPVQFEAAKAASAQRAATSVAAADSAVSALSDARMKRAGTYTFVLRDGVWTDIQYKSSGPVLRVKPFSDAYFRIIELQPDLREWSKEDGDLVTLHDQPAYQALYES